MSPTSFAALLRARADADDPLLRRASRVAARAAQGVTRQGIVIVAGFSALYGITLSVDPRTGGALQVLGDYATAITGALMLFLPAYALAAMAAQFAPRRLLARALVLAFMVAAGIALGYMLSDAAQVTLVSWRGGGARHTTAALPVLMTAWLGLAGFLLHERERAAAQALHDEAEQRLDLERRMSEARLQVLQSQIEPHFLFNSLAHARRLCRTNQPAGRAMLRHLAHYIGAAQPALRHAGIALAADVDLAVAYLNVQQIRMRERLRFDVDVAAGTRDACIPPMTLTTLVENAIKHGLSPLEEGGTVTITARVQGDAIVVDVKDSGQSFQSTLGAGVGLANSRARLAMLHGEAASLDLAMNAPRGVIATVVLPRGECGTVGA